jgi:hypothetical protein
LINSPTTVTAARDRQEFSKSTAYKYANMLAELGVAVERDEYEDGSALWRADPVSGNWTDETTLELGPAIIAVYRRNRPSASGLNPEGEGRQIMTQIEVLGDITN